VVSGLSDVASKSSRIRNSDIIKEKKEEDYGIYYKN
jgi:hypothetical protein|tara:strand:+ start:375 stop:482 length:108 start_codon:yes stop_codon:yes gene_type:complete